MDRRLAGALTVLLGLLAAIALPVAVNGARLAGAAQREDVPVVGECVIVSGAQAAGSQTASAPAAGPIQLAAAIGCSQPGAGRVLARSRSAQNSFPAPGVAYDAHRDAHCGLAVQQLGGSGSDRGFVWQRGDIQIGVRSTAAVSADLATVISASTGAVWILCYATGPGGRPLATTDPSTTRELEARCFLPAGDDGDALRGSSLVDCRGPHTVELLGETFQISGSPGKPEHRQACRAFAAAIALGRSDPTAGGLLDIEIVDRSGDPDVPGNCVVRVAAEGALTGSLLGVGEGPLPWG